MIAETSDREFLNWGVRLCPRGGVLLSGGR
jgi:hypothetical protein